MIGWPAIDKLNSLRQVHPIFFPSIQWKLSSPKRMVRWILWLTMCSQVQAKFLQQRHPECFDLREKVISLLWQSWRVCGPDGEVIQGHRLVGQFCHPELGASISGSEIHPCHWVYWLSIPFYCWVTFLCMNISQFYQCYLITWKIEDLTTKRYFLHAWIKYVGLF